MEYYWFQNETRCKKKVLVEYFGFQRAASMSIPSAAVQTMRPLYHNPRFWQYSAKVLQWGKVMKKFTVAIFGRSGYTLSIKSRKRENNAPYPLHLYSARRFSGYSVRHQSATQNRTDFPCYQGFHCQYGCQSGCACLCGYQQAGKRLRPHKRLEEKSLQLPKWLKSVILLPSNQESEKI